MSRPRSGTEKGKSQENHREILPQTEKSCQTVGKGSRIKGFRATSEQTFLSNAASGSYFSLKSKDSTPAFHTKTALSHSSVGFPTYISSLDRSLSSNLDQPFPITSKFRAVSRPSKLKTVHFLRSSCQTRTVQGLEQAQATEPASAVMWGAHVLSIRSAIRFKSTPTKLKITLPAPKPFQSTRKGLQVTKLQSFLKTPAIPTHPSS